MYTSMIKITENTNVINSESEDQAVFTDSIGFLDECFDNSFILQSSLQVVKEVSTEWDCQIKPSHSSLKIIQDDGRQSRVSSQFSCGDRDTQPTTQSNTSLTQRIDCRQKELRCWGLPKEIVNKYEEKGVKQMFEWQVECLGNSKVLLENENLVYSAPTSAGKTLVAELLSVKTVLERQKKVLFILPFVSVVREKMFYFQEMFSVAGIRVEGFMGSHAPPGGFQAVHIAICTIEKANSLVNKLLEEGNISDLGAVVVDELHLLGDSSRGYILELLLTKIKYVSQKYEDVTIQIIGMSATLPNLHLLSTWLNAELYITEFRPIPLDETCLIKGNIYNRQMKMVRNIKHMEELKSDTDNIIQMCLETISEGCSVLIFCSTKNWCENLAQMVSSTFFKLGSGNSECSAILRSQLKTENIVEVLEQLKGCPVGLDNILKNTISFGVAFHHAGLTMDERDIIEGAFKSGAVRVLAATSTLSSGVNLPARRVIIRSPVFHRQPINILTYKQMIGRAGRMGKDIKGESILICSEIERKIGKELMSGILEPVKSCIEGGDKFMRAILEVIASQVASTQADLEMYAHCTLLYNSEGFNSSSNSLLDETLKYLVNFELVRTQKSEEGDVLLYVATPLGKACLSSSMAPNDGLSLFSELQKARQCVVLETDLHLVYLVTPYSVSNQWGELDWMHLLNLWESLIPAMRRVGELIGIQESFIFRCVRGSAKPANIQTKIQIHKRFYTALALQDLINEVPLSEVAVKFQCSRGMLQSLQQSAATFAGMVTAFCHQLGWKSMEMLVSQFQDRLHFGIHSELLELMKLPSMNGLRARSLYNAGIETLCHLTSAEVCVIENSLHAAVPFQSEKERDGEHLSDAQKRNKIKNVWITGHRGMTAREAAQNLIDEARKYLQLEIGVTEIKWKEKSANGTQNNLDGSQPGHSVAKEIGTKNKQLFNEPDTIHVKVMVANPDFDEPYKVCKIVNQEEKPISVEQIYLNAKPEIKIESEIIQTDCPEKSLDRNKVIDNNISLGIVENSIDNVKNEISTSNTSLDSDQHLTPIQYALANSNCDTPEFNNINNSLSILGNERISQYTWSPMKNSRIAPNQANSSLDKHYKSNITNKNNDKDELHKNVELPESEPQIEKYKDAEMKTESIPLQTSLADVTNNFIDNEKNCVSIVNTKNSSDQHSTSTHAALANSLWDTLDFDDVKEEKGSQYLLSPIKSSNINLGQENILKLSKHIDLIEGGKKTTQDNAMKSLDTMVAPMVDNFEKKDLSIPQQKNTTDILKKNEKKRNSLGNNINVSGKHSTYTHTAFDNNSHWDTLDLNNLSDSSLGTFGTEKISEYSGSSPAEFKLNFQNTSQLNIKNESPNQSMKCDKTGSSIFSSDDSKCQSMFEESLCVNSKLCKLVDEVNTIDNDNNSSLSKKRKLDSDACYENLNSLENAFISVFDEDLNMKLHYEEDNMNSSSCNVSDLSDEEIASSQDTCVVESISTCRLTSQRKKKLPQKERLNAAAQCKKRKIKNNTNNDLWLQKCNTLKSYEIGIPKQGTHMKQLKNRVVMPTDICNIKCFEILKATDSLLFLEKHLVLHKVSSIFVHIEKYVDSDKPLIGLNIINKRNGQTNIAKSAPKPRFKYKNIHVKGLAVYMGTDSCYYISFEEKTRATEKVLERLSLRFCTPDTLLYIHSFKSTYLTLRRCCNIEIKSNCYDPCIAEWLIDSDSYEKSFNKLIRPSSSSSSSSGRSTKKLDEWLQCCVSAWAAWHTIQQQIEYLKLQYGGATCALDTEMHVVRILAQSEYHGIGANKSMATQMLTEVKTARATVEERAYKLTGHHFNFNSPKDVAKALGMYKGRKICTKKSVLEMQDSPLSRLVIYWRKLNAILTKTLYPLTAKAVLENVNDRIHTSYVTHTTTGRICMHEPNIQNVPRNFDLPAAIFSSGSGNGNKSVSFSCRDVFQAAEGCVIISADYCQLEMRILTHMCGDRTLMRIMNSDMDVFRAIAASWANITEQQVDEDLRQKAKSMCYGIVYGMGCKALSEQLAVSELEASVFMDTFHATYPAIRRFTQRVIQQCKERGYVETLKKRRRYFPAINSTKPSDRSHAERQAVNTTVQGSAADIAKSAMIAIDNHVKICGEQHNVHMILQMHDELIYEVAESQKHYFIDTLKSSMEQSVELLVPLPVKVKCGSSWGRMNQITFE